MKYWDSSALVAIHVQQKATSAVRLILSRDGQVLTWALSDVEVRSALCRLGREGAMTALQVSEAITRIESFFETVNLISVLAPVRTKAKRLLGIHPLRAADAMQLAAALTAVYDDPAGHEFVCLDDRLADAARREGFALLP